MAEVHGRLASFRVFTTGAPGVYLFDLLDPDGVSVCLQFPVWAADLRPELRRALRHGWGLTTTGGAAQLRAARSAASASVPVPAEATATRSGAA